MKKEYELLNVGTSDVMNILSLDEMDNVVGGKSNCKKDFSISRDSINCGCGYTTSDIVKPITGPGEGGISHT